MILSFKRHDSAYAHQAALDPYCNHPKVQQLVQLVTILGDFSEGFRDPLGKVFMQAMATVITDNTLLLNPFYDMMTAMTLRTPNDGQSVADCACGSGRMLLSAAKINRHLKLYGADLDITCCKMALVNMLLNSLQGEIAHMNSLSNDFYRGYKVQTTLVDGY